MPKANFMVVPEEALKFAQVWTYKGLSIPIGPEHAQFATDYANIVLRSFIDTCQKQAQAARPLTTPGKPLIIEGVN